MAFQESSVSVDMAPLADCLRLPSRHVNIRHALFRLFADGATAATFKAGFVRAATTPARAAYPGLPWLRFASVHAVDDLAHRTSAPCGRRASVVFGSRSEPRGR